jgi:hypothetical protein
LPFFTYSPGDLGQPVEEGDAVPLRVSTIFAAHLVLAAARGGER